jgi:hypothetical protein
MFKNVFFHRRVYNAKPSGACFEKDFRKIQTSIYYVGLMMGPLRDE